MKTVLFDLLAVMVCAFAIVVLALAGLMLSAESQDYTDCINENWGIAFPEEAGFTMVYEMDEGPSFHGDGLRYHVFEYEEQTHIESMLLWNDNDDKMASGYAETIRRWLDSLKVPVEQRPDYADCKYTYMSEDKWDEILLLWDAEEKRIYAAESFM